MSTLNKLSSALGRRDEVPNQELASQIAVRKDKKAILELVENLRNKNKDIQNDCIKVLYEVGEREPGLVAEYAKEFIILLEEKNNRLQWGAMTALSTITLKNPKAIYAALAKIISAANRGSVITKDNGVNILIKLCTLPAYKERAFTLLLEQLSNSPTNQLPMYAEKAMSIVDDKNKTLLIKNLAARLGDIEKETKRKRVEKVIKKLTSQ